jgi:hypothetical protein
MRLYRIMTDGWCLLNGNSRYELREGDTITTEFNDIYGDMITYVHGSFNMKFYPIQLKLKKITKGGWDWTGYDDCNNTHPDFNPNKECFCAIHQGVITDITKQVIRDRKLNQLGI